MGFFLNFENIRRARERRGYGRINRLGRGYRLTWRQWLPQPPDSVMGFYRKPENLRRITPWYMGLRFIPPVPPELAPGMLLRIRMRAFGLIPIRWEAMIAFWQMPVRFQDVQHQGPYRRWRHTHTFEPAEGGTRVTDWVDYELKSGTGGLFHWFFIGSHLHSVFRYRSRALGKIMSKEKKEGP